ncbi:MAG: hypothetical protein E4G89_05585 [Methanothrix sp.]|nr:MAG: hypothetical protein E4G89_05585 [Methanothrix sp.]
MSYSIKPFMATGIGSMPFTDPAYACNLVLSKFPDAPFWPQLPKLGFAEDMVAQYSEGIAGITLDFDERIISGALSSESLEEMTHFYESYMAVSEDAAGDVSVGRMTEDASKGLFEFLRQVEARGTRYQFIKVQTTGPCTFALGVKGADGSPVYYAEDYRDLIVKALAMKCRWQIRTFSPFAEKIICFIDEPVLSAFGSSAYLGVKREDVVALLAETGETVHLEGGLAAVHCCGNTEWTILIDAGVDIINFDAYEYGETIALYHSEVSAFLSSGGILAWGAVPTSDVVMKTSVSALELHLEDMMDHLASKGISKELIVKQAIITPACGTGSIPEAHAERVFEFTRQLSQSMMAKYALGGGGSE